MGHLELLAFEGDFRKKTAQRIMETGSTIQPHDVMGLSFEDIILFWAEL